MPRRWLREDALNISMAAGDATRTIHSIVSPVNDTVTPADVIAVLMLSAHIDGWNWRRALVDGHDIASDVIVRMTP